MDLFTMLYQTSEYIENIISIILIPGSAIYLTKKLLNEKKETGNYNYIRLMIIGVFFSLSFLTIMETLYDSGLLKGIITEKEFGQYSDNYSLYNLGLGVMVTFGVTMIFLANRLEAFYYSAFFFFAGIIIFYYLTGFDAWLVPYINFAAVFSLIFLYYTGIRIKDDAPLGLAIIFTFAFVSLFLYEYPLIEQIMDYTYLTLIFLLTIGYLNFFKNTVEGDDFSDDY
ncbi:MAG: hypothetical protein ACTSR8_07345 [Promethearchaeota archaeon]